MKYTPRVHVYVCNLSYILENTCVDNRVPMCYCFCSHTYRGYCMSVYKISLRNLITHTVIFSYVHGNFLVYILLFYMHSLFCAQWYDLLLSLFIHTGEHTVPEVAMDVCILNKVNCFGGMGNLLLTEMTISTVSNYSPSSEGTQRFPATKSGLKCILD